MGKNKAKPTTVYKFDNFNVSIDPETLAQALVRAHEIEQEKEAKKKKRI